MNEGYQWDLWVHEEAKDFGVEAIERFWCWY